MAAITLENLAKVYPGGVRALDGLDLDVAEGEFVVLVGPSGCGKTTALRLVAGLETITEGTVKFGGTSVNGVSPRHRDVAMVFQNYALYPHLTVAENLGFSLVNKGVPRARREERIQSVAEVLGLSPYLRRTPAHLSGGQRQRVAMGRAIIREPAVFCMDEPLSNLDAKLRAAMRAEIVRVHQSIGAATLYVTHDQVEAMTMGDRVVVLDQGVLQQCGTPRFLYEHPANLFVASFIGSPEMNLFQGAVTDSGELVLGSQRLTLPEPPAALAPYRGREVIAGWRPEALTLANGDTAGSAGPPGPPGSRRPGGAAAGVLSADVRAVESIGSEAYAFFAIDAPAATAARTTTADIPSELRHNGVARLSPRKLPRPGEPVTFRVDSARLLFFDPDTGRSIA
jgi:multiple sugar transport system ATP-binding protein